MIYPRTPEYRFDLSGSFPDNLVKEEVIKLNDNLDPIVVPKYAPFYHTTLQLTMMNGEPMVYGTDYEFYSIMGELSRYTGKAVGAFIKILNTGITQFKAQYQTVGSLSLFDQTLADMWENLATSEQPVEWKNITNKPVLFDPKWHYHDVITQLYGFKDFADALGDLIDWMYPELTYKRDLMAAFRATDLINDQSKYIVVKRPIEGLSRLMVRVSKYYKAITNPPPHLAFFQQQIANGLTYIQNYVNQYIETLNLHIKNQNNPHGYEGSDIGLGNRDNFGVLTLGNDSADTNYSSKKLITPAWFANMTKTVKGRTDNYVQKNSLPISRFGDNTYIPPVIDSEINGIGIRHGYGAACLERGGWLSVLVNNLDLNHDELVYLKIADPSNLTSNDDGMGGVQAQTRYKYQPKDVNGNVVALNTVIRGSNYKWAVVGNSISNKWYLAKTNGTFKGSEHVLYPITFPISIGVVTSKYLSMSVTDTVIHFCYDDLSASNYIDLVMMSINISTLTQNANNAVSFLNIQTVDQNNAATTQGNGKWRAFPVVKNSDGKYTRWFTNFTTPVTNVYCNRMVLNFIMYAKNGTDFYLRMYFIPTINVNNIDVGSTCSVVFKMTKQSDGSFLPSVVKGDPSKSFNSTTWDPSKSWIYNNHTDDTANLPFMNEFFDYWPGAGLNSGTGVSSSQLSDGRSFAFASTHWVFYPMYYQIVEKDEIDLTDLTAFTTGHTKSTRLLSSINSRYINNPGPGGFTSGIVDMSVYRPDSSDSTVDFELMRGEIGTGNFHVMARRHTGDKTLSYTDPYGKTWLRSPPATDIRSTDLPPLARYIHWVDERDTSNNGETFFSIGSGTTTGLSSDIGDHCITYDQTCDYESNPNKLQFKETRRLVFTQECIKYILGVIAPASVYDGKQTNWNLYWFPGKGGTLMPLMCVYWIDTSAAQHVLKMSAAVLKTIPDPTLITSYGIAPDGVYQLLYNTRDLMLGGNIVTGTIRNLNSAIDNTFWVDAGPKHAQPGTLQVYVNAAGEISIFGCSTVYLASTTDHNQGSSIVPTFAIQMKDSFNIQTLVSNSTSWDVTSASTFVAKGIGILASNGMNDESFMGGCVIPGRLVGKSWNDWGDNINNAVGTTGLYYVGDLTLTGNFAVYLTTQITLVFDGASYLVQPVRLDLSNYKSSPANTTFYLYFELKNGVPELTVKLNPVTETSKMMYVGTVVTDGNEIASINTTPVFTMNGYRVSESPQGSSIPASTGDVNAEGIFAWGTQS